MAGRSKALTRCPLKQGARDQLRVVPGEVSVELRIFNRSGQKLKGKVRLLQHYRSGELWAHQPRRLWGCLHRTMESTAIMRGAVLHSSSPSSLSDCFISTLGLNLPLGMPLSCVAPRSTVEILSSASFQSLLGQLRTIALTSSTARRFGRSVAADIGARVRGEDWCWPSHGVMLSLSYVWPSAPSWGSSIRRWEIGQQHKSSKACQHGA